MTVYPRRVKNVPTSSAAAGVESPAVSPTRPGWWARLSGFGLSPALLVFLLVLAGGPFVMYAALLHHAENEALKDAKAFSSVIQTIRSYYATNVSGRILANHGQVTLSERYKDIPGGVPIPATLSIELGERIRSDSVDKSLQFSFVSDAPFLRRSRAPLNEFQAEALKAFRKEVSVSEHYRVEAESQAGPARLRLAIPVRMEAGCVACHNGHPDSPVRDWKVGDVRGIQEVSVNLGVLEQADQSAFLAAYLLLFFATGVTAILEARGNNRRLKTVNDDLAQAQQESAWREERLNDTVAELGTKTTVIERAPFGVILAELGPSGLRFSYANPNFCAQSGYSAHELLGAPLALILGPMSQVPALEALHKAIESSQTAELELILHRRDGSPLWTRVLLFPTFDDQQRLQRYVLCVNDITEVRRAEEERQRLAGELHETMKLESLGLTIAGIAHDLNTPIGVAITASSHLEQLGTRFKDAAQQAAPSAAEVEQFTSRMVRSTELIRNNLNKAAVLVRSFKQTTADASRTEWRTIALRPFLDSILLSVSPIMRRARCEVSITCPDQLSLHTEPGSLGSALTNLLINATIHAFEGRDERRISLVVSASPQGVRISCADNGVGMSEEAVSKAFTPFFTTKRNSGGSGLGLFSSRRTVEQVLNGKLTMETIQGEGTTFHLDLPIKEASHDR